MSKFDALTINGYTRRYAASVSLPKVKRVETEELKFSDDWQSLKLFDPFSARYLPPHSDLLIWRSRLRDIDQDVHPFIHSDHGNFVLDTVEQAIKLHDAKAVRECVSQEIQWFRHPPKRPQSVAIHPSQTSLETFQHLVSDTPLNSFVRNLSMKPGELARLAHNRYLSSDHMQWYTKKLNAQQNQSLCVYLNGMRDIQKYISDHFKSHQKMSFIVNVGKLRDGRVFLGSDTRGGCHWTLVSYDNIDKSLVYADSLAWSPPDGLTEALFPWLNIAFGVSEFPEIVQCHISSSLDSSGSHVCTDNCTHYPLQTCSNICGPVAVVSMVAAALSERFFKLLTSVSHTSTIPSLYLKDPSKYGKYLRQVLIDWIVNDTINHNHIILQEYLSITENPNDPASDSDDDFDVATLPTSSAPSKPSSLPSKKSADNRFLCSVCDSSYTRRNDLKRHMEKAHSQTINRGDSICLHCDFRSVHVEKLREHLSSVHGIDMEIETLSFQNYEEFEEWKFDLEEATKCSYVKQSGVKTTKFEDHVQHFKCNRSGKFKSRRVGRRRVKSSGSCKTEMNCTSFMRMSVVDGGVVNATVCKTHYGHATEIEHIRFNRRQRGEIAAKLAQGVSRDKILDDIRDNVGFDFRKIHLLDRRDIGNIKNAYNIDTIKRHENDQQSVLSWIKDWEGEENNPILYYSLQGQESEYDQIKKEDFMIIIQTEAQRKLLQKFGKDGVCADATHGTTGYDFLLSTLLVVDEFGHGQPVAWCLATHETEEFLNIFFSKVAESSGKVKPRWFMSDIACQYYNSYCKSNECPGTKRLLCSWHVDKAWKKALNEKVQNVAVEAELYLKLKTIQQITNENLFESTFQTFVDQILSSNVTKDFGEYVQKQWVNNKREWGYCFRAGDGINTNMFVESFHHTLKYKYLKRKHNRRVEFC